MALPGIRWLFFHPYVLDGCVKDFDCQWRCGPSSQWWGPRLALIFHDLPAGDQPLVRMSVQKVLVRFHPLHLWDLVEVVSFWLFCVVAFIAAWFCFSIGWWFCIWKLCFLGPRWFEVWSDWMSWWCDSMGWLGLAFGYSVFWLKDLTMALLSHQFKFHLLGHISTAHSLCKRL